MKEGELELEIICTDCEHHFKGFNEMLIWYIPKTLLKSLNTKQKPHLKCPFCRNNRFVIKVLKDAYGEYEE